MCEENTKCGGPRPEYIDFIRKRYEILCKIKNGDDKYQTYALWQKVVDSLARGADPLLIIEQLMDMTIAQGEQLLKKALAEPTQILVTQLPNAVLWQAADKNNLPAGEVLARNKECVHFGELSVVGGIVCADSEGLDIHNVTHYITIENLLKKL